MQFKFDANQEYQVAAIEAVAMIFEGQAKQSFASSLSPESRQLELTGATATAQMSFVESLPFSAVDNRLTLSDGNLLSNLQAVQQGNNLPVDSALQFLEEKAETFSGEKTIRFANFSVEMETGTGKTYVYIRTALELFKRFGFRKFIIVVPSVAIREGVLKTFQVTERHFRELFSNTPYRFNLYDSENLSQVRQFATSASVEFLVMTIDSFNKASNVIRQQRDQLQGETPIHLLQATRPILILDEPQNMESELRIKALAALNPLLALRYSATHRNPYNVIYKLTPFEAYRQSLVKRIEVAGVEKESDANQVFMRLMEVRIAKTKLCARLAVHQLMAKGQVKEKIVTVEPGASLQSITKRPEYAPFVVEEITDQSVIFANGIELKKGEARGADKEAIFETQIRYTIKEHFRKDAILRPQGIKVLSLFFIDRVENYASANGLIRLAFEKAFNELRQEFPNWKDVSCNDVQGAYFAERKTKAGEKILEDTKTGDSEKDKAAYDLILRMKEKLLSFDEPTAFIFSHSALREGWDNPNVFQICTLNQTLSEIKKRQEIGRGIRLAVNQTGERVRDEKVNVLTVVANENYESYVSRYQSELEEAYGADALLPKPANARKRGVAKLRKAALLKPEFKELWERIKHKTRYSVEIDSEALIKGVVEKIDSVAISAPKLTVKRAELVAGEGDEFTARLKGVTPKDFAIKRDGLPNLVEVMANLMENTTPPVRLTRRTLLEVFKRSKNSKAALANPHEFATVAVRFLKYALADQLVNGIQYEKINQWYEMTQLEAEIESWQDYLVESPTSVYDHVLFNSEIERKFVEDLENDNRVQLYLKLPAWFTVATPVGEYNPDWAIVMDDIDAHGKPKGKERLYLVRETKDTSRPDAMRPNEGRKIECGKRHFKDALGVDYKVVKSAAELP